MSNLVVIDNVEYTLLDDKNIDLRVQNCMTFVEKQLRTTKHTYLYHDTFKKTIDTTWPKQTSLSCWHDGHKFTTVPIPLVQHHDIERNIYQVYGVFCSVNCAKAYIIEHESHITNVRMLMFNHMIHEVFHKCIPCTPAPPRVRLQKFGGDLNITEFRKAFEVCTSTIQQPPFVSAVRNIIETKHTENDKNDKNKTNSTSPNIYENFVKAQQQQMPMECSRTDEKKVNTDKMSPQGNFSQVIRLYSSHKRKKTCLS